MALGDSNIAPSNDASAARSWGGTRVAVLRWRRTSSSDCTIGTVMVTYTPCGQRVPQHGDFVVENRRIVVVSSTGSCRTNVRTRCNNDEDPVPKHGVLSETFERERGLGG